MENSSVVSRSWHCFFVPEVSFLRISISFVRIYYRFFCYANKSAQEWAVVHSIVYIVTCKKHFSQS